MDNGPSPDNILLMQLWSRDVLDFTVFTMLRMFFGFNKFANLNKFSFQYFFQKINQSVSYQSVPVRMDGGTFKLNILYSSYRIYRLNGFQKSANVYNRLIL